MDQNVSKWILASLRSCCEVGIKDFFDLVHLQSNREFAHSDCICTSLNLLTMYLLFEFQCKKFQHSTAHTAQQWYNRDMLFSEFVSVAMLTSCEICFSNALECFLSSSRQNDAEYSWNDAER